jgi:PncC family amidohydrolase
MTTHRELQTEAARLAKALQQRRLRIVFSESCTGGLAAAALAGIPGISAHLCGSAVVYRTATKAAWLGIPDSLLDRPGPVSSPVAAEMAARILQQTPEADLAVSVTGHLGPDAPQRQDGLVFIGVALRDETSTKGAAQVQRHRLPQEPGGTTAAAAGHARRRRQREAARLALAAARETVQSLAR